MDGNVVSAYDYDDNGNRIAADLTWSQLGYSTDLDVSLSANDTEYNDADQLLTYGTKSYSWNNFGQLQEMYDSATDETTTYEYDLYGNLLSVGLPDGRTIEYDVDGAGRRVGRRELDAQGNEISFRGSIYRDLLRPIAEVDALGNVTARYVYSDGSGSRQNGLKQLATRLGALQDTSLPFNGSNVPEVIELLDASGVVTLTLVLVADQVGSVQLVTDASTGDVVQRIEYDSFGRVLSDSAPGLQPFGYAGGLHDSEADLVRFGARDYSMGEERWTARDPVGFVVGHNSYRYSDNDGVNLVDGLGLAPIAPTIDDLGGLGGGGVGAGAGAGAGVLGFGLVCLFLDWLGGDNEEDDDEDECQNDLKDCLDSAAQSRGVCYDCWLRCDAEGRWPSSTWDGRSCY